MIPSEDEDEDGEEGWEGYEAGAGKSFRAPSLELPPHKVHNERCLSDVGPHRPVFLKPISYSWGRVRTSLVAARDAVAHGLAPPSIGLPRLRPATTPPVDTLHLRYQIFHPPSYPRPSLQHRPCMPRSSLLVPLFHSSLLDSR